MICIPPFKAFPVTSVVVPSVMPVRTHKGWSFPFARVMNCTEMKREAHCASHGTECS
jgi:hypothetical protein